MGYCLEGGQVLGGAEDLGIAEVEKLLLGRDSGSSGGEENGFHFSLVL